MKIAVIGAGKMGQSFSKSFLKFEIIKQENLHLIVRNTKNKDNVQKAFPRALISSFDEVNDLKADVIVLAVKPQDYNFVAEHMIKKFDQNQLLLSIMAGITIEKIQLSIQHKKVVRAMPNSPSLVGMGITGYTAADGITINELAPVERLLNSTGRSVYIEDESLLDAVTALSGSGPAYFFYIVDAMIKAGIEMGIEENLSKLFVSQTMLGAYHLINNSEKTLTQLITDVASKGGTTQAALNTFDQKNLKAILKEGILNAEQRAKELNK